MEYHMLVAQSSVRNSLAEMFRTIIVGLGCQCRMQWWRKTSYMLNCHHIRVTWFQELVEYCKYLRIEHLEATNAIHHPFQSLSIKIKYFHKTNTKLMKFQVFKIFFMQYNPCWICWSWTCTLWYKVECISPRLQGTFRSKFQYTHNSFNIFVFPIHTLHTQYMVAEVKCLKASLLPQQHYHGATSPVQPFTK